MKAHEWVANTYRFELSDFHKTAIDLLCMSQGCGPYDLQCWKADAFAIEDAAIFKLYMPRLATFDSRGLTTLVIGAHAECIRVEISPVNFKTLEIAMFKRYGRDGDISMRHPTIADAIADFHTARIILESA